VEGTKKPERETETAAAHRRFSSIVERGQMNTKKGPKSRWGKGGLNTTRESMYTTNKLGGEKGDIDRGEKIPRRQWGEEKRDRPPQESEILNHRRQEEGWFDGIPQTECPT